MAGNGPRHRASQHLRHPCTPVLAHNPQAGRNWQLTACALLDGGAHRLGLPALQLLGRDLGARASGDGLSHGL